MEIPRFDSGPVTVLFGEKNGKYPDGNQVIVQGKDTKVIFDTPLSANNFSDTLVDADMVLLSHVHEDHTAGLHLLPQAECWAHESDVAAVQSLEGLRRHYGYEPEALDAIEAVVLDKFKFQPRPDAKGFQDGHEWELGGCRVRAVHLPGHTAGHCALVVEPHGIAFIADIDLSSFGPYYGDACSSLPDFRRSLELVEQLDVNTWITSHHKGVITERETFLDLLRPFRDKLDHRSADILEALQGEGRTLGELMVQRFLYPPGYKSEYSEDAERRTIEMHLEELVAKGAAIQENGRFIATGA